MITPGHFAIGMGVGTALFLPSLARAWSKGGPVHRPLGWLLVAAYALGIFAVVPNLMHFGGVSIEVTTSALMNVFLLHPFINEHIPGGKIIGGGMLLVGLGFHYLLLVTSVWRAHRRKNGWR